MRRTKVRSIIELSAFALGIIVTGTLRGMASGRDSEHAPYRGRLYVNDELIMTYLQELRDAIKRLHGCESKHLTTAAVVETSQGETVWKGEVEIFALIDHPTAKRCFAWAHETDEGKRYVAVLELPPVTSAQTAVRAAIVNEIKKHRQE